MNIIRTLPENTEKRKRLSSLSADRNVLNESKHVYNNTLWTGRLHPNINFSENDITDRSNTNKGKGKYHGSTQPVSNWLNTSA